MYWRSDGPEILRCVDPLMLSKKPDQIRPASSALFTQPVVIENIPPLHPSAAPSFTKVSSPSKRNQSASTASGNQKHRAKRSRLRQKGSQRDIIMWPRKTKPRSIWDLSHELGSGQGARCLDQVLFRTWLHRSIGPCHAGKMEGKSGSASARRLKQHWMLSARFEAHARRTTLCSEVLTLHRKR